MTLRIENRVRETIAVTGTGAVTLGALVPAGYRGFAAIRNIVNGDTFPYTINDATASAWEIGLGTYATGTPNTFSRAVQDSSNSGSLVSFAGNSCDVFLDVTAAVVANIQNRYETSVYTASGAIAITDDIAVINASSAVAMTLANGAVDGRAIEIKRIGAGTATVAATIDSTSQTLTMNAAGTLKDSASLRWIAALSSYILE